MNSSSSAALTTLAQRADLWEVPFIAGHKEISIPRQSTSDELVVIRIRRDGNYWSRVKKFAAAAEQVKQGIDLIGWKAEPGPEENAGIFLENLVRKTWNDEPLIDRHDQQSFVPSG
jgi:hypothetical protein